MYNYDDDSNQIKIDLNDKNIPLEYIDISIINNNKISYQTKSDNDLIKVFKKKDIINIFYGMPILDGKTNYEKINEVLTSEFSDNKINRNINGEFLLISLNLKDLRIKIVNDRFSSYPLYYYSNGRNFFCSTNYFNLIKLIKNNNINLTLNNSAFAEFLWFRKIHGEITFHNEIYFLPSASEFEYYKNLISINKYWLPSFKKNNNSFEENVEILNHKFTNALKLKSQDFDKNRIGLFLSGGMDTRLILSSFLKMGINPICFTVGYNKFGEYKTAKTLTNNYKLEHYLLELPENLYDIFWKKKLILSSAFHVPFHNIFVGFRNKVCEKTDVVFHGHGLDYLFQGMYLPVEYINIFGKKTFYNYFKNLNLKNDIIDFYMKNIKYRNWRVNLNKLSKENKPVSEMIKENLKNIFNQHKKFCFDNFDIWESLMIDNQSRHYSQTDINGIHSNNKSFKICYENDLFNFYLSLKKEHRLNGRLFKEALKKINIFMANTKSANTNYKITAYATELNMYYAYLKIMRFFSSEKKYQLLGASDKTWPNHDTEILVRKKLNDELKLMIKSDRLLSVLNFFDNDKLIKYVNDCLNHKVDGGGQFLMGLLTIEKFLEEIDNY